MKKIFFTLLTITFTIQGYSQTSQQHFQELEGNFSEKEMYLSDIRDSFIDLSMLAEWNSAEHANMGQQNLSNNWSNIRSRFNDLEMFFYFLKERFSFSGNKFMEIGNVLGNFDGNYESLSGLPTLFDGNFSSLSGTPTTLAGYGITDAGDSPFSYNSNEAGGIEVANYTTASGSRAFAVGSGTEASGVNAFASGDRTKATYSYTTAMGYKSQASNFASTAFGKETTASGQYATAMGQQTTASQNASTAMGNETTASGIASTAMGEGTTASGDFSTAMGRYAVASNQDSTAMGKGTIASGVASTAMGFGTIASGDFSTAIGDYTLSSGDFSTALGKGTIASGGYSTAMGYFTTAEDYMTLALGTLNKTDETPNPDNFSYQNTAFVIGNGGFNSDGAYDGHLSNAFEVLFDGTTTIAGDLNVNSDKKIFFGNQSFIEGACWTIGKRTLPIKLFLCFSGSEQETQNLSKNATCFPFLVFPKFFEKKSPGRLFPDRRTSAFTIVFYGIARAGPRGSYDKYLFNEDEPQQEL